MDEFKLVLARRGGGDYWKPVVHGGVFPAGQQEQGRLKSSGYRGATSDSLERSAAAARFEKDFLTTV